MHGPFIQGRPKSSKSVVFAMSPIMQSISVHYSAGDTKVHQDQGVLCLAASDRVTVPSNATTTRKVTIV